MCVLGLSRWARLANTRIGRQGQGENSTKNVDIQGTF